MAPAALNRLVERYFSAFLDRIQNVATRYAYLTGRIAETFLGNNPTDEAIRAASSRIDPSNAR